MSGEAGAGGAAGVSGAPADGGRVGEVMLPRGLTFAAADWVILARHWFPVAAVTQVDERAPLAVTLLDVALIVYRVGGAWRVARDLCPHRGVPLSLGRVEGDELVCAYHGLRYGPDGQCRKIPAQPDAKPPARFRLTLFPAVERYGLVWTCLDPQAGAPGIPPFPEWDDPAFQPILPPHVDIAASAGRQVEGFVDVAHFAWVHHETFADRDNAVVPSYTTQVTAQGLRSEYLSDVSNYPKGLQHLAPPGFRWLRVFEVYPPFAALLTVHFPDNGRLRILNLASPVSARRTRLFVPLVRNFDTNGSLDEVYAFNAKIFAEDQAIVERQCPEELPLGADTELHFAADRTSVEYRRLLKAMGLSFSQSA